MSISISRGGCQTCKIRRIKQCDETTPICLRCTRSRRICLATAAVKEACFAVLEENSFASGKSKRPRGPRSRLTLLRPQFDLQTRALAYYLHYHLKTLDDVPNVSGGLSECVAAWKISGRTCPMVDLALSSTALAVYSRTQHHPPAASEASSTYHRLLRLARERIARLSSSPSTMTESNIDACLMAAFLMGRYETVTHRPSTSPDPDSGHTHSSLHGFRHYDGVMAILKVWNESLAANSKPATFIIKHTRRQAIKLCLIRDIPLPDWILDGSRYSEHGIELGFDRIIVWMANLRRRLKDSRNPCWQDHYYHSDGDAERLEALGDEARQLDRAVQDWAAQISLRYPYHRHILDPEDRYCVSKKQNNHFYSAIAYSYSDVGCAALWVEYFAARLFINSLRLDILEQYRPLCGNDGFPDDNDDDGSNGNDITDNDNDANNLNIHAEEWQECSTTIQEMADNLAHSVPFCLERLNNNNNNNNPNPRDQESPRRISDLDEEAMIKPYLANWIVWPLTVASSVRAGRTGLDAAQRRWFKAELAHLGRSIGDGVLACADREHWLAL